MNRYCIIGDEIHVAIAGSDDFNCVICSVMLICDNYDFNPRSFSRLICSGSPGTPASIALSSEFKRYE